jgi:hypothetical protein
MYFQYDIPNGVTNDFLEIILQRIEDEYITVTTGDFSDDFTTDFESFLAGVDLDPETAGNQPYTDPLGNPILTLADTQWFGPARTWPKELPNYPYIEFWHQLDTALMAENIDGMGPELLGEDAWSTLFSQGYLVENPDIYMDLTPYNIVVTVEVEDQNGAPRPANALSDIGAIEYYSPPCLGDIPEGGEDGDVDGADLAEFIGNLALVELSDFAAEFGRVDCPRDLMGQTQI